ncbi:MAG: hypothetical protein HY821_18600 [Acidobacteria bacterium]|nr:hypothetical protein [Acidobacteriota bacterium]
MNKSVFWLLAGMSLLQGGDYENRVSQVRKTRGLAAFWDFVQTSDGLFAAHVPKAERHDLRLRAANYVLDYWGVGRAATYADFPRLGRGPFGEGIEIRAEREADFRPVLLVPRKEMHDSGIDAKGPGRSVSMVAWVVRTGGNHAIAGIWHEGTDLKTAAGEARRVEAGRRQYAIFAGLAGNSGASAVHVSENGGASFGDRYARNMAVTAEVIPQVAPGAPGAEIDRNWTAVGFTFDNAKNTVTAYWNGQANEYWIENPQKHPFYQWAARGWTQADLRRQPGLQEGEDAAFPVDQFYAPPERRARKLTVLSENAAERVELVEYEFTRVRVTRAKGRQGKAAQRQLVALKANPFWFGHDLYRPRSADEGGPFTVGRVIHSSRNVGFTGWIGGVAVFDRSLPAREMKRLAEIGRSGVIGHP